jgi:hypothetical protein
MPVKRAGAEVQQNPIRLKNLLREAEQKLEGEGAERGAVRDLLQPAHDLLKKENTFWMQQEEGLILLLGPDEFHSYRLPFELEERVVVGPWFHMRPLARFVQHGGRFFVLTLSQGGVHLFEATRYSLREIELEGIPLSLEEALKYDDFERHVQFHTSASGQGRGRPAAIYHGQGVGTDDARDKDNILRFFRQVDNGVRDRLAEEQVPLVLAGGAHLQGIYREANHYTYLAEEGVDVNPEDLGAKELHRRALEIVAPRLLAPREEAVDDFQRLFGTGRASDDLETVVPAAYHRRVDTLFVPAHLQCWGAFSPERNAAQQHKEARQGDVDLIDEAVAHTLLNTGSVYVLQPDDMPALPVAAIFRY